MVVLQCHVKCFSSCLKFIFVEAFDQCNIRYFICLSQLYTNPFSILLYQLSLRFLYIYIFVLIEDLILVA